MPSLNKQWSVERLALEDYPMNFVGFSAFTRWGGPLVAKPGDVAISRRGVDWIFVRAKTAVATPTFTAGIGTFTVNASGELVALTAVATAGAGYNVGEVVPVLGGLNGTLKVKTANAAGGILTAALNQNYISPNTLGPKAVGGGYPAAGGNFTLADPAAPWTTVIVSDAFEGEIDPGAGYKSFAPFDIGEFGWVQKI